jgi:lactate dehydrogenase-like 2-hydroxyacid dehydrogenase
LHRKPLVVVTRKLFGSAEEILRSRVRLITPAVRSMTRTELRKAIPAADGVLCQLTDRIDVPLLNLATALRAISVCAVGYENVDLAACREKGISVAHTPGVLTEASADHAMALLLAVARRVVEGDRQCRSGRIKKWDLELMLGKQVSGATLGILGMGRIGRAVARRARGFEMRVLYTGGGPAPAPESGTPAHKGMREVTLKKLLASCDFISVHVPGGERTRHLVGEAELARIKPGAVLINTSRGSVLDTRALVSALRSGRLGGAGLDVFEHEPQVDPALVRLKNVVLTPHVASATLATRTGMADLAARNLVEMLCGRVARATLVPSD